MPHDYRPQTKSFVGVPRPLVRKEIDKLTDHIAKQAALIGRRYEKGKITLAEFELQMRELLKSGHIIAASVGKGGRSRMTLKDWGKVGSRLKKEYTYLSKFRRKIGLGKVPRIATANRAKKYASSIVMSYHETVRTEHGRESELKVKLVTNSLEGCEECAADEAAGWMNLEDMGEIGTRICGNFCKCDLVFSDEV